MSRFRVRVVPEAETEFLEAFTWYRERSEMAANAFRAEVLQTIDSLEISAAMWPRNEDGISYVVLNRFPYTVFYDLAEEEATVLAVAHHRRLPRYWLRRQP